MSQIHAIGSSTAQLPPLTSFIGRGHLLAALDRSLRDEQCRLLTLTGPGGVGKSRLAVEAATRYADDVLIVSLAEVPTPAAVLPEIARQLRLRDDSLRAARDQIVHALRDQALLLLLDNLEHLIAAGPRLVDLLNQCPSLKILVTSRIPLRVGGEREYPVPPMAVPALAPLPPLAELRQCDAVALLIERARAVRPDFALTEVNAAAVAEICVRLDGLPLAIELAAARLKILSPPALLARLTSRLQVLINGPRDQPARLQTMRAAIAWSYDLLGPAEQALFRRLAVFAGGFSLDAAAAIAPGVDDTSANDTGQGGTLNAVLDGLTTLVDHSLVQRSDGDREQPRFTLLEMMREFGVDRLAAGEDEAVRRHHAAWVVGFVEAAAAELRGPDQALWLGRVAAEEANVHAAQEWLLAHREWPLGLRLAVARYEYWLVRGAGREDMAWLAQLLAIVPNELAQEQSVRYARVLNLVGVLHYYAGDQEAAQAWFEGSLARRQALGDRSGQADTLNNLSLVTMARGDPAGAAALAAEAVRLGREVSDRSRFAMFLGHQAEALGALGHQDQAWELLQEAARQLHSEGDLRARALLLRRLGAAAYDRGEPDMARTVLDEALALYRRVDDGHDIAIVLRLLSQLALRERRYHDAAEHVVEALRLGRVSEDPALLAGLIDQQAAIAVATGQPRRAAELIGQAETLYDLTGAVPEVFSQHQRERTLAAIRSMLGEHRATTLRALGGSRPLEQAVAETVAVAEALSEQRAITDDDSAPRDGLYLTRREQEVLVLLVAGYTNRQIGDALFLSHRTVATHVSNLLAKLDAPTRAAAATEALRRGLVDSSATVSGA